MDGVGPVDIKRRVGIIGASGFLGRALARELAEHGWRVIGFSRENSPTPLAGVVDWRRTTEMDLRHLDAIVNLAGFPIDRRWTDGNCRKFHESRVGVTQRVVKALAETDLSDRPRVFINGTAVGIYGDRGDDVLEESSALGTGYLADLCREWEAASWKAEEYEVRVVCFRTGVVLGRGGMAYEKMRKVFQTGLGGRLGDGRQWMPWIHVADWVGGVIECLENESLHGPVNGSAPEPERNADLTRKFGVALHRPAAIPVPKWVLHMGLGDFAGALLASNRAVPKVLEDAGYHFRYRRLEDALAELLGK